MSALRADRHSIDVDGGDQETTYINQRLRWHVSRISHAIDGTSPEQIQRDVEYITGVSPIRECWPK